MPFALVTLIPVEMAAHGTNPTAFTRSKLPTIITQLKENTARPGMLTSHFAFMGNYHAAVCSRDGTPKRVHTRTPTFVGELWNEKDN